MSVHDNILAGKYENRVPRRPEPLNIDPERVTIAEADRMRAAREDRKREQYRKHAEEGSRLMAQLRADLEAEHGLTGHPKADAVWNMAWDRGHSAGYTEVASEYEDLAELVK